MATTAIECPTTPTKPRVFLTVTTPSRGLKASPRNRKTIPSPEASRPFTTAKVQNSSKALPSPTPKRKMEDQVLREIRHIKFDFELLDSDNLPRFPTPEESETLKGLFPTHFGVCVVGPFLQILVREH
jgi:hypothetical protein